MKRPRSLGVSTLALALLALIGCSLVVDTSDIDAGCNAEEKLCNGRCVLRNDPAFGCEPGICTPCDLPNAVPSCNEATHECEATACVAGFGCDKCRTNLLTDEANCGECHKPCGDAEVCANGTCVAPRSAP